MKQKQIENGQHRQGKAVEVIFLFRAPTPQKNTQKGEVVGVQVRRRVAVGIQGVRGRAGGVKDPQNAFLWSKMFSC